MQIQIWAIIGGRFALGTSHMGLPSASGKGYEAASGKVAGLSRPLVHFSGGRSLEATRSIPPALIFFGVKVLAMSSHPSSPALFADPT